MIETREFDLHWEGRRCQVSQLGAKAARSVARRLLNTVGTAVREMGLASGDAVVEIVAGGAVMERLDDATLEWLTETFSKVTRIEKEAGSDEWIEVSKVPDLVFGGGEGLGRWVRWLAFCVEMSCGPFFREIAGVIKARQQPHLTQPSKSPMSSVTNGGSTGSPLVGGIQTG